MALTIYRGPAVFEPVDNPRLAGLAGLRLASLGRRALALGTDDVNLRFTFFSNWYSLIWLALYFGLTTYWGQGRTPAKKLVGIRIVSLTHERISLWPNRQTVHDRIAETIVIDDRRDPPAK